MGDHSCEAVIVSCIDFRFQDYINKWIVEHFHPKTFDRIAFAGGVKSLDTILGQIEISERLHHIKKVILINHEDCGAYGDTGTTAKHVQDLKEAKDQIKQQFPNLDVESYYLHLDGQFESIP